MPAHALLATLLIAAAPPAAPAAEACAVAVVAQSGPEAIRLEDGSVFLPDDPKDLAEIGPGDVVFACPDHLREGEGLLPIPGAWIATQT